MSMELSEVWKELLFCSSNKKETPLGYLHTNSLWILDCFLETDNPLRCSSNFFFRWKPKNLCHFCFNSIIRLTILLVHCKLIPLFSTIFIKWRIIFTVSSFFLQLEIWKCG